MHDLIVAAAQLVATPRDVLRNVQRHARLASLAADDGAQMVIFPELSLTSYDLRLTTDDALTPDDVRLRPLSRIARERDIVIVAGGPVAVSGGLSIGAMAFHPSGESTTYLKQYPTATEQATFIPGPGPVTLTIGGDVVGLAICADVGHPEHSREAAERGATVYAAGSLLSVEGYAEDAARLQGYAAEHRMLALVANYGAPAGGYVSAGRSAAWSNDGELLASAPPSGEALVVAERMGGRWAARIVVVDGAAADSAA